MTNQSVRIVFITTVPETAWSFLSEQVRMLTEQGFEVHTISSPMGKHLLGQIEVPGLKHEIPMLRTISPLHDLVALMRLWRLLRWLRPQIVHTHTPKAGLLGMIAASLANVPIRIYTVNGLAILTQPFWGRILVACSERLACSLATRVLCVSRSARRFMIANRLCPATKCRTLGDGGSHGVDVDKFDPAIYERDRCRIRRQYGVPEHALLLGYIGRIIPEKGVIELACAWNMIRDEFPDARLFLCGYCERDHPLGPGVLESLQADGRVHLTETRISNMPPIYAALDICVLPSYREGLSNVALESSAMKVPIVTTRVPGCVDAVRDGVTGLLVEVRNPEQLAQALRRLMKDPELRSRIGASARDLVSRRFAESRISSLLLKEYRSLMKLYGPVISVAQPPVSFDDRETRQAPVRAARPPEIPAAEVQTPVKTCDGQYEM